LKTVTLSSLVKPYPILKKLLPALFLAWLVPALCFAQPAKQATPSAKGTAASPTEFTTAPASIVAAVKTLIGAAAKEFKQMRQEESKQDDALAKAWKYKGLLWLKDEAQLDRAEVFVGYKGAKTHYTLPVMVGGEEAAAEEKAALLLKILAPLIPQAAAPKDVGMFAGTNEYLIAGAGDKPGILVMQYRGNVAIQVYALAKEAE
jgi:hypothetical protein